jgi:hypothetical protein
VRTERKEEKGKERKEGNRIERKRKRKESGRIERKGRRKEKGWKGKKEKGWKVKAGWEEGRKKDDIKSMLMLCI